MPFFSSPHAVRILAILGLIALLVMPIGGCSGAREMSGIDVLTEDGVPSSMVIPVVIALVTMTLAAIAIPSFLPLIAGIAGLMNTIIGYIVVRSEHPISLLVGAYIAILCYIGFIVLFFIRRRHGSSEAPPPTDP